MRYRPIVALAVLPALLWFFAGLVGCSGYRIHRSGNFSDAKTVAIVTLVNGSTQPGVELIVSEALRKEFLRRGVLDVVSNPDSADLVVAGEVLPFHIRSRSVSSVQGALEYSIDLGVELRVHGREGSPASGFAYKVPNLNSSMIYPASADVEAARNNRQEALRRAAEVLAGRAYDALELRLTP